LTANRTIIRRPSQKFGIDTPSRAKVIAAWSTQVFWRSAATMPVRSPKKRVRIMA